MSDRKLRADLGDSEDARDAERWRALLSSQRVKFTALSGFKFADGATQLDPAADGVHFSLEIWDVHPSANDPKYAQDRCRDLLNAYVDELLRRQVNKGGVS